VLYADSSVLVKHYLDERGSDNLNAKITETTGADQRVITSVLSFAEVHAALARKLQLRPALRAAEYHWATTRFNSDWRIYLARVQLIPEILDLIPNLVKRHFLKGSEAVHLASALWAGQRIEFDRNREPSAEQLIFATSDKQLARVARYEQLKVFDPEDGI
jgi:predicted nucleic acid-binding protein